MQRKPVPWIYSENGVFKNWEWNTPHFKVKVIGEGDIANGDAVFTWQIIEKNEKGDFIFENSTNKSLRACELEIVEIIAKSWDKKHGYDIYAGTLATTFQIYGNEKLNVEEYVGNNVTLKISEEDGDSILTGVFGIKNYNFLLKLKDGKVKVIPPLTVKEIKFL